MGRISRTLYASQLEMSSKLVTVSSSRVTMAPGAIYQCPCSVAARLRGPGAALMSRVCAHQQCSACVCCCAFAMCGNNSPESTM
jgi:hypothetical protein